MIPQPEELLVRGEPGQRLSVLNKFRRTLPGPLYLHQLVAPNTSQKTAIDYLSADGVRQKISYQSMREYARCLARQLPNRAGPSSRPNVIPVLMPQCPELYISYLAILETGAGFCPIQTDVPAERLRFILRDISADLILSTSSYVSSLRETLPGVSCLQVSLPQLQSFDKSTHEDDPSSAVAITRDGNDVAYVMYTSGSTGLPKGVEVSHNAVVQSLLAHHEHIPLFKRFLQFASPTFDVSVFEIFFPFFRGATLVCCERESMLGDLAGTIRKLDVDAAELTPTIAGTLLQKRAAAPCLKILLTIGEMLNRAVIDEFGGSDDHPSMLYAMYGPTEAAIHCTLATQLSANSSVQNIGVPLSTVTALILAEVSDTPQAQILPIGQIGELAIVGQLARGYLNRPKETSAAFIEMADFGTVYRTGDRAMITEQNTIRILGRLVGSQVKLRGQRIELGEIEEVALKTSGIKLAIASIVHENLVLFCSGTPGLTTKEIRETCEAWLPRFMRPSEIVILLEGLPRLPSGKVDRRKLERDFQKFPTSEAGSDIKIDDQVKYRIADIASTALGTRLGPETSWWAHGLDSLKAIKIATDLRRMFPQVSMMMLLECSCVNELAERLSKQLYKPRTMSSSDVCSKQDDAWQKCLASILGGLCEKPFWDLVEKVLPCSPVQIAMLSETCAQSWQNFNTISLEHPTSITESDICYALQKLAAQNQILRSGFQATNIPEMPFIHLVWQDLFLNDNPTLLHPLQVQPGQYPEQTIVKIHHALYDGWSWNLILSDLNSILSGLQILARPQFNDFYQYSHQSRAFNFDVDQGYWAGAMAEINPRQFPNLQPKKMLTTLRRQCQLFLDADLTHFNDVGTMLGISHQSIVLTAFVVLLSAYYDSSDVLCGVVSSGREQPFPGIDQVIGPCLSNYPLRINLLLVETVRDLLLYVQRTNLDCLKHGSLSLNQIKNLSHIPRSHCFFDTLFIWQAGSEPLHRESTLLRTSETFDALNHALVLEAGRQNCRTWIKLTIDEAMIPTNHANLILRQLNGIVTTILTNLTMLLPSIWDNLEVSLLSKIMPDVPSSDPSLNLATTIKMLARKSPDRTAIEFARQASYGTEAMISQKLSYEELYTKATKVAREMIFLAELKEKDIICIVSEKSVDLYLAILAAFLSGVGFMCLSPYTSDAQISKILQAIGIKLMVTSDLERFRNLFNDDLLVSTISELSLQSSNSAIAVPRCASRSSVAYLVLSADSIKDVKAVSISHMNLLSNIDQLTQVLPCQPEKGKLLQSTPQDHGIAISEIFWTWRMGMTLCSASNDDLSRNAEALIHHMSITHLSLTPDMAVSIDPLQVSKVEVLIMNDLSVNSKSPSKWRRRRGFFQTYGHAEVTNIVSVKYVSSDDNSSNLFAPIFNNTSVLIGKEDWDQSSKQYGASLQANKTILRLAPLGSTGNIWIGGDQLGLAYTHNSSHAENWLMHPEFGLLYNTGDRGRLLANGNLMIVGSENDRVRFQEQALNLRDVDTALLSLQHIDCAATLLVDAASSTHLVSFVVTRPYSREPQDLIAGVFRFLQDHLVKFMIPDTIIPVQRIFCSRWGKIDYDSLADIYRNLDASSIASFSRPHDNSSDHEPVSMSEKEIAKIVSNITKVPLTSFTRHTLFYRLGLDSVNAIAFMQALKQAGYTQVDVSTILENASVALLAPLIRKSVDNEYKTALKPQDLFDDQWMAHVRSNYGRQGLTVLKILPCTPLQESMLSSQMLDKNSAYYNRLTWKMNVDAEVMRLAWLQMVDRHDILRTIFVESQNPHRPFAQAVLSAFKLPWLDVQSTSHNSEHKIAMGLPPYSFRVEKCIEDDSRLLTLTIHHAIYDAEAMTILLHEVQDVIREIDLNVAPQFDAYVEYMLNIDMIKVDTFWAKTLRNVKPTRLKALAAFSKKHSTTPAPQVTDLASRLSLKTLGDTARCRSTRLLTLLQASLARLLCCYLGSKDVCFGNVFSGRALPLENVQHIVGPCFNTLPLRVELQPRQSVQGFVDNMHRRDLEASRFQTSSLRQIQSKTSPDGRALFDIMLLLQQHAEPLDKSIWSLLEDTGNIDFPYILEVIPNPSKDELILRLHHQNCDTGTATTFLQHFDEFLNHTTHCPESLASEFVVAQHPLFEKKHQVRSDNLDVTPAGSTCEWSNIHKDVRKILVELLDSSTVPMDHSTSIFMLGLDSINAMQIAARLRAKGYSISGADVLDNPTIAGIALHCNQSGMTSGLKLPNKTLDSFNSSYTKHVIDLCPVDSVNIEKVLPCTPAQSGILSQFVKSNGSLYYNRTRFVMAKDIDLDLLNQSWKTAVTRHEMLRTGFWQLDDAKFPFAMIIYKSNYAGMQLSQVDSLPTDTSHRGSQALQHLYRPTWEMLLKSDGSQTVVDLWMLHALYDAKSTQIILGDVAMLYKSHRLPQISPVDSLVFEILRASQPHEQTENFWTQMGSTMQPTKFPDLSIHCRPPQRLLSTSIKSKISKSSALQKCSYLAISLQTACQAAWARILAAYCGQQKVTFGVILSGRVFEDEELNRVAFPCINTVPVSVEVSKDDGVLLSRLSELSAGLMRFQNTPLATIKKWAGISGEVFDTVFVVQKFDTDHEDNALWSTVEEEASGEYTASLEIIPTTKGYKFQLTYRPDLIPSEQADIILEQYESNLCNILQLETDCVAQSSLNLMSVLPPKELLLPSNIKFLHEFVRETAKRQPDATAIEFFQGQNGAELSKQTWSYEELNARGNQIANWLIIHGVQVGDLVSVCFDKCPEASFAILGILKAGCAYIAIDPDTPDARKLFILQDAGCKMLLTTKNKSKDFNFEDVIVLEVDSEDSLKDITTNTPTLKDKLTQDHSCYCLYTSGTTGTPKGCLISHASAVQAMLSFSRIFEGRWSKNSRWLQFASFHFDVSVLEQYWSWSVGICMTSIPRDLLFEDLPGMIHKLGITHLDLTPSLARLLMPNEVPNLCGGVFIVGGEQIHQEILEVWGGIGCLFNFYGPSEVTIGCTVHPKVAKQVKATNIGQQWDNVGTFVLDPETDQPVIRGAVGELCLSGPLVGKGYLNRPELTSKKFIILPKYGTRIYRSGDLVRMLHDDSFDFIGRTDSQVKLRGQRMEIGEINHVVDASSQNIKDVTTLVLKHPGQEKEQLVSFLAVSSNRRRVEKELRILLGVTERRLADQARRECSAKLPAYMVPTYFVMVQFMPLNANNKSDHNRLKHLFEQASIGQISGRCSESGSEDVAPAANFARVTQILAKFLDVNSSNIRHDSKLLELGLDSISVIGLSRIMKREGFLNADVPTIMRNSVVLDLARAVDTVANEDETGCSLKAAQSDIENFSKKHWSSVSRDLSVGSDAILCIGPCAPLQQGMISRVVSTNLLQNPPYFGCFTYRLHNDTSVERLQRAWTVVARALDILRTRFVPTADGYAQVILKQTKVPMLHLRGDISMRDINEAFSSWVQSVRSFGKNLPWQICFSQDEEGIVHMSLFLFHGLYDGASLSLLLDLVKEGYIEPEADTEIGLQFHSLLAFGPLLRPRGAEGFWKKELQRIAILNLDDPSARTSELVAIKKKVDYHNISYTCNRLNVTTPAVFQAAWLYTLFSRFGITPAIGIVVSGRSISFDGAENVIGPMFNTIPYSPNNLPETSKLSDLIVSCHNFNVRSVMYQHTSISDITKWIKVAGSSSLFDSLFVFQKTRRHEASNSELWVEISSSGHPDYPLNIEIDQADDGKTFNITVLAKQSECLSEQDVELLLNTLDINVKQICEGDDFQLPQNFYQVVKPLIKQQPEKSIRSGEDILLSNQVDFKTTNEIRTELAVLSGTDAANIHTDSPTIFELGMDSIDALKLAARLKNKGILISVGKIMQNPTVAGIAKAAKTRTNEPHEVAGAIARQDQQTAWHNAALRQGLVVGDHESILAVTPMQEGLLLEYEKYYHVLTYQLHDNTSVEKLSDAIRQTAKALPITKTRFLRIEDPEIEESFLQSIGDEVPINLQTQEMKTEVDVDHVVYDMRRAGIEAGISGPLFLATVASILNGPRLMFLGLPHALYDGWSLQLLHSAIKDYYEGKTRQHQILPMINYLGEFHRQSQNPQSGTFWERKLRNARSTVFRLPNVSTNAKATLIQQASGASISAASSLCKETGITLQTLGLACWSLLLAYQTQSLDVSHGLVLSGRTTEGADELVFPTFNTVIFRTQLQPNMCRQQLLKQIHESSLGVMDNQFFPLKKMLRFVRKTGVDIFNTLFTFQKVSVDDQTSSPLYEEYDLADESINPPYAVNIEMTEKHGQLWWTCAVQDNVADFEQVKQILRKLDQIMIFLCEASSETGILVSNDTGTIICDLNPVQMKETHQLVDAVMGTSGTSGSGWNPIELKIRAVLAKIAKIHESEIERGTGIFHLGLDSVSAIKIAGQMRKAGLKLSIGELIRAQTLENMAKLIIQEDQDVLPKSDPTDFDLAETKQILSNSGIPLEDIEHINRATAGQVYMLDAWQLSQKRLFYADFWFRATATKKETFEQAFEVLYEIVPALRTLFIKFGEEVFAVVFKAKQSKTKLPWLLQTTQKGDDVLAKIHIHHALYDAVSLHIMVQSLTRLCRDREARLDLHTNISSFHNLTRSMGHDAVSKRQKFWTTYLGDVGARKVLKGSFSSRRSRSFVPNLFLYEPLRIALREHGISIQTLFFAVYAQVHASLLQKSTSDVRNTRPNYVVLGVYMANRFLDVESIDVLVAPTFNILPLKIKTSLSEGSSLVNVARQIQKDIQDISRAEYCGASLREIHAWTGLKVDAYMNFLRLPDDPDGDGDGDGDVSEGEEVTEGRDVGNSSVSVQMKNAIKVTHAEGESLYDAQSALLHEAKETQFGQSEDINQNGDILPGPSPYLFDNRDTKLSSHGSSSTADTADLDMDDASAIGTVRTQERQEPEYELPPYIIPAIDVEARITRDGNFAMGIFAPTDIFDDLEYSSGTNLSLNRNRNRSPNSSLDPDISIDTGTGSGNSTPTSTTLPETDTNTTTDLDTDTEAAKTTKSHEDIVNQMIQDIKNMLIGFITTGNRSDGNSVPRPQ